MSNKFNGRIQQKHATAAEWSLATNFKPLEGELIVYEATSEQPYPRFKVGDGINFVNDLPFSDEEVWAALADKQPLGDYATKDYVNSQISDAGEIEVFDLTALGIEKLDMEILSSAGTSAVISSEVASKIAAAAEAGHAKFTYTYTKYEYGDAIDVESTVVMNSFGVTDGFASFGCVDGDFSLVVNLNVGTRELMFIIFPLLQIGKHIPYWDGEVNGSLLTVKDGYLEWADDMIPTKTSDLTNDSGFLTQHQSLAGYAKTSDIASHNSSASAHSDIRSAIPTKVSQLTNDSGYLTQHQSLADYAKTADLTAHNTNASAHNDIRLLVTELTNRLNALADSDDTTLDQMSELVTYVKNNKNLIDGITTSKVNVSDIINNLTTNVSNKPLSAAQGVALKALIDAIVVPTKVSQLTNDKNYLTQTELENYVNTQLIGGAW